MKFLGIFFRSAEHVGLNGIFIGPSFLELRAPSLAR
jgi:hypothetical protein